MYGPDDESQPEKGSGDAFEKGRQYYEDGGQNIAEERKDCLKNQCHKEGLLLGERRL